MKLPDKQNRFAAAEEFCLDLKSTLNDALNQVNSLI